MVEIHEGGRPYPIEYKRGSPKAHRADEVQLCAQAVCLEEMLSVSVDEGALFYGAKRRRKTVAIDAELRALTAQVAEDTRRMLEAGKTPLPEYSPRKCDACSLQETCQPQRPRGANAVELWLKQVVEA